MYFLEDPKQQNVQKENGGSKEDFDVYLQEFQANSNTKAAGTLQRGF